MPQPGVIIEWYGDYPLTLNDVNGAVQGDDGWGDGAHLLCIALGDGGAPYRCSIGHWLHDANQGFPLDIPEDLVGAQCYLGEVVSYGAGYGGASAAAWALLRVLQPGRRLVNPANPQVGIPEHLQELPDHARHYCMSVVSWFYSREAEPIDPPPGFPVMVRCNQHGGNDEWLVFPQVAPLAGADS